MKTLKRAVTNVIIAVADIIIKESWSDIREELFHRSRTAIRSSSQLAIVFPTRYHPAANLYRARLNAVSTVQVVGTIIHDKSSAESLA